MDNLRSRRLDHVVGKGARHPQRPPTHLLPVVERQAASGSDRQQGIALAPDPMKILKILPDHEHCLAFTQPMKEVLDAQLTGLRCSENFAGAFA